MPTVNLYINDTRVPSFSGVVSTGGYDATNTYTYQQILGSSGGIDRGIHTPTTNGLTTSGPFPFEDFPVDFSSVTTLQSSAYGPTTLSLVNDTAYLYAQIFKADGVTALTDEKIVVSATAPMPPPQGTTHSNSFSILIPTATRDDWNGARLHFRWSITANMGADSGAMIIVDEFHLYLSYVATPYITQAAYRIYEDGPETTSVALAAQDTPAVVNTGLGDAPIQVRTRLQSTSATAIPATEDFKLFYEHTRGGLSQSIGTVESLSVKYDSATDLGGQNLGDIASPAILGVSVPVLGDGRWLTSFDIYLGRIGNGTPGSATGRVWAHAGAFGSVSYPAGPPLTSSTPILCSTMRTTNGYTKFTFPPLFLESGKPYLIGFDIPSVGDASNYLSMRTHQSTSTYPGGPSGRLRDGVWTSLPFAGSDYLFEVYTTDTWAPVSDLVDKTEGASSTQPFDVAANMFVGQSFKGDGQKLARAEFILKRAGVGAGTLRAQLYAHTGTYGSGGLGTGTALISSSTVIDVSTLSTNTWGAWYSFDFGGTFTLEAGTAYVIGITNSVIPSDAQILFGAAAHAGNMSLRLSSGGAWSSSIYDAPFRVFGIRETLMSSFTDTSGTGSQYSITGSLDNGIQAVAQSFIANVSQPTTAMFWLSRAGTPTGNVTAEIYPDVGVFGTSSRPRGGVGYGPTPLLISDPVPASSVPLTNAGWVTFTFPDTGFRLTPGTAYCVAVRGVPQTGAAVYGYSRVPATAHPGNTSYFIWHSTPTSAYWNWQNEDVLFQLMGALPRTLLPYDSTYLTEGQATTKRLTGGTGTFTAGKVSEDGIVDDLGWAGNNHTEVMYPVQLKQSGFVEGDTVRFKTNTTGPSVYGLLSSYDESNASGTDTLFYGGRDLAQSFMGDGNDLLKVGWYLSKTGAPTGTVVADLYAHDAGTFGSSGKPTGTPLATSRPIDLSVISTSKTWYEFEFSSTARLTSGTPYFAACRMIGTSDVSNALVTAGDYTSPTAPGNAARLSSGVWAVETGFDSPYRIYTGKYPALNVTTSTGPQNKGTVNHLWTITPATGAKPVVPPKLGSATASHTWTVAPATGMQPKKGSATAGHLWTIAPTTGKRVARSPQVTASHLWTITPTTGKRYAKTAQVTSAHLWLLSASGKRKVEGLATTAWTATVAPATGRKIAKSGTLVTPWLETTTATGKRKAGATVVARWNESFGSIAEEFDGTDGTDLTANGRFLPIYDQPLILDGAGNARTTSQGYGGLAATNVLPVDSWMETSFRLSDSTPIIINLIFRSTFPVYYNTGYWVSVSTTAGGQLELHRLNPLVGAAVPVTWLTTKDYTLRAEWVGGVIKVFLDGVEVISYTDPSPLTGQHVALYSDSNYTGTYDLFRYWRAGTSTAVGKRTPKSSIVASHVWTTTAAGQRPGVTPPGTALWTYSNYPTDTEVEADTAPILIGTRFTVDQMASVTGIRYYRPPFYGSGVTLELRLHEERIPMAGLQGWWDAADDSVFGYSSGTSVSEWIDKSGAGNHVSQVTVAKQPLRDGIRNGRKTLVWASGKGMVATPTVPIGSVTEAYTLFAVFIKTGANASFETPFTLSSGNQPQPFDAYNNYRSGHAPTGGVVPDLRAQTSLCIWTKDFQRNWTGTPLLVAHSAEYLNGVVMGSTEAGNNGIFNTATQKIVIGSRADYATSLVGEIGEVIIYNRLLSTAERQQVEAYLKTKWGVA